jgi:hypothetical protein
VDALVQVVDLSQLVWLDLSRCSLDLDQLTLVVAPAVLVMVVVAAMVWLLLMAQPLPAMQ